MLAVCSGCEIGAEGAASLAPELQHLKLLQSLNLACKQQGSGGCVQRVGLGRSGWYFERRSCGCFVQCWGVGCWSMVCVCWVLGILMRAAMLIVC